MCLAVLAWCAHPRYRLIVAANRDEYHDRPAAPLAPWPAPDELLAGRDLRAGGTWLGIDRGRRFGIITNYRDLHQAALGAPSRGGLIPDYLRSASSAGEYLRAVEPRAADYGGFNLLLADGESLWYGSNRSQPCARQLEPGVYGLSNEQLDAPWPKVLRVRRSFEQWLRAAAAVAEPADLLGLLDDRRPADDSESTLTQAGPLGWTRVLSAPFVEHPDFGTRCSTVVLLEHDGAFQISERRFDRLGRYTGETHYSLRAAEWC
jgi:uncharacterized protein with NRDE domain